MFTVEKNWITKDGFRAVVIMNEDNGCRCGYVGVSKDHPLYGAEYSEPHPALNVPSDNTPVGKRSSISIFCASAKEKSEWNTPELVFDVHGGITYSRGEKNYPVESDLWWFGYDCAHAWDLPSQEFIDKNPSWYDSLHDSFHRSLNYCENECESLSSQIKNLVSI